MDYGTQNGGRSVIGAAFELLDYVGALEPVRLIDLAGQRYSCISRDA